MKKKKTNKKASVPKREGGRTKAPSGRGSKKRRKKSERSWIRESVS
jgi:hypothetical protein